jgi:hypothetical protein
LKVKDKDESNLFDCFNGERYELHKRREGSVIRKVHRLRVFEKEVLRILLGPKSQEVIGKWRKLRNEDLHNLYCSRSTRCGKLTSFFELSDLKRRGAPGGGWSRSREGILKLCDVVVQEPACGGVTRSVRLP